MGGLAFGQKTDATPVWEVIKMHMAVKLLQVIPFLTLKMTV